MSQVQIHVVVTDPVGNRTVFVAPPLIQNDPPVIDSVTVDPLIVPSQGGEAVITVSAHDPEGEPIMIAVSADVGTITQESPTTFRWRG
jgi:hypothetical protein